MANSEYAPFVITRNANVRLKGIRCHGTKEEELGISMASLNSMGYHKEQDKGGLWLEHQNLKVEYRIGDAKRLSSSYETNI